MSMFSTIPAKTIEAIADMREAGMPLKAIARATGVHYRTCQYHAGRLGAIAPNSARVPQRHAECIRSGRVVRPFSEAEDQQITAWSIANVPLIEMGRRLGRKHNSVLMRLRTLARREALAEASS